MWFMPHMLPAIGVKRDSSNHMMHLQSSMLHFWWAFANYSRIARCWAINIETRCSCGLLRPSCAMCQQIVFEHRLVDVSSLNCDVICCRLDFWLACTMWANRWCPWSSALLLPHFIWLLVVFLDFTYSWYTVAIVCCGIPNSFAVVLIEHSVFLAPMTWPWSNCKSCSRPILALRRMYSYVFLFKAPTSFCALWFGALLLICLFSLGYM